jgi:hypothetical protein
VCLLTHNVCENSACDLCAVFRTVHFLREFLT